MRFIYCNTVWVRRTTMTRRCGVTILAGLALLFLLLQPAWAVKPVNAPDGVAIEGFDVVAYFTDGGEAKGETEFMHKWKGAIWLFKNAANRDLFAASPEKYAPQYGGYCALSVANGKASKGSGEAWHIEDGKVYLNYDKDVRRRWLMDTRGNIHKADDWWPRLVDKE